VGQRRLDECGGSSGVRGDEFAELVADGEVFEAVVVG
jgi:hypothetical protein